MILLIVLAHRPAAAESVWIFLSGILPNFLNRLLFPPADYPFVLGAYTIIPFLLIIVLWSLCPPSWNTLFRSFDWPVFLRLSLFRSYLIFLPRGYPFLRFVSLITVRISWQYTIKDMEFEDWSRWIRICDGGRIVTKTRDQWRTSLICQKHIMKQKETTILEIENCWLSWRLSRNGDNTSLDQDNLKFGPTLKSHIFFRNHKISIEDKRMG